MDARITFRIPRAFTLRVFSTRFLNLFNGAKRRRRENLLLIFYERKNILWLNRKRKFLLLVGSSRNILFTLIFDLWNDFFWGFEHGEKFIALDTKTTLLSENNEKRNISIKYARIKVFFLCKFCGKVKKLVCSKMEIDFAS